MRHRTRLTNYWSLAISTQIRTSRSCGSSLLNYCLWIYVLFNLNEVKKTLWKLLSMSQWGKMPKCCHRYHQALITCIINSWYHYIPWSDSDRNIYSGLKNELKDSICQAKIDYLKWAMAKAKSCPQMAAQVWAHVNSVLGWQVVVEEDNKLFFSNMQMILLWFLVVRILWL